jgi:hypothetical protein
VYLVVTYCLRWYVLVQQYMYWTQYNVFIWMHQQMLPVPSVDTRVWMLLLQMLCSAASAATLVTCLDSTAVVVCALYTHSLMHVFLRVGGSCDVDVERATVYSTALAGT